MYSEFIDISPQKAQEILNLQDRNRRVVASRVKDYAQTMMEGRWDERHPQGLIFDKEGTLLNGQHRLLAVIQAQKTIRFYCTLDAEKDSQILLDTAAPRRVDQTAQIIGLDATPVSMAIARALLIKVDDKKISKLNNGEKIISLFKEYQEGINFASKRQGTSPVTAAIIRVAVARAYYHHKNTEDLAQFLKVLDSGFPESPRDSCAIALRNNYLNAPKRSQSSSAGRLALYRRSLNAVKKFLDGEVVKTISEAKVQLFPLECDCVDI